VKIEFEYDKDRLSANVSCYTLGEEPDLLKRRGNDGWALVAVTSSNGVYEYYWGRIKEGGITMIGVPL
jgi:hypothetical protein